MRRISEELGTADTYGKDELFDFIEGSTLLATGGGGEKQIACNMLEASGITEVTATTLDRVPDEIPSAMVAQVFAPSALWACQDYHSALRSFQQSVGRGLVYPGETGAVNGIVPAIVAAMTGSVLLKGATSDRSLPELDMTLFQDMVPLGRVDIVGPNGMPACSQDFGDDRQAIHAEDFILSVMSQYQDIFKGVGGFAAYPLSGGDLKKAAAAGLLFDNTFDYSIRLGRAMRQAGTLEAVLAVVQDYLGGGYSPYRLFTGYFVESGLHPHAQDYGYFDFRSADPESILGLRIYSSNENMIAFATIWVLVRGAMTAIELFPVAIGPDGITYLLLEGESGKGYKAGYSFSNEAFDPDYGDPDFFRSHRVAIIGIPEPRLRRQDIIDSFHREISLAMQSFQKEYTFSYVPIEDLPKLAPCFDIHGTWGETDASSLIRLQASPHQGKMWHSGEGILKGAGASAGPACRAAELAGRTMVYGRSRESGCEPILTVTWPAL